MQKSGKKGTILKVYQNIHATLIKGNILQVYNENFFINLTDVELYWEVVVNGKRVQAGTLAHLNAEPQKSELFTLPIKKLSAGEAFLNLSFKTKSAKPLIPAGYEIAVEQLSLGGTYKNNIALKGQSILTKKEIGGLLTISSPNVNIAFDMKTGFLTRYTVNKQQYIDSNKALKPNFWRAPNDNDFGAGLQNKLKAWKASTEKPVLKNLSSAIKANVAVVKAEYELPEVFAKLMLEYSVNSTGELLTHQKLTIGNISEKVEMLPRFGMQWVLPQGFNMVEYYGRGPQENYQDRSFSTNIAIYKQSVDEQYFPYVTPQETGNKTDIRWYKIINDKGKGLQVTSDVPLSISALHYFDSDLDDGTQRHQRHATDLVKRPQVQWNIDFKQMGVGGTDSWGSRPMAKYQLPYTNYEFSYLISPFSNKNIRRNAGH